MSKTSAENKETHLKWGTARDFITRVAMMKTNYIYYGLECDRFNNILQTDLGKKVNFSDVQNSTEANNQFSESAQEFVGDTAANNESIDSSENVRTNFLDFDGLSSTTVEKLDFTVFVSS